MRQHMNYEELEASRILSMKNLDADYARWALKSYHEQMPHLDLMNGVREALK